MYISCSFLYTNVNCIVDTYFFLTFEYFHLLLVFLFTFEDKSRLFEDSAKEHQYEFCSAKSQRQINAANPNIRNKITTIPANFPCQK